MIDSNSSDWIVDVNNHGGKAADLLSSQQIEYSQSDVADCISGVLTRETIKVTVEPWGLQRKYWHWRREMQRDGWKAGTPEWERRLFQGMVEGKEYFGSALELVKKLVKMLELAGNEVVSVEMGMDQVGLLAFASNGKVTEDGYSWPDGSNIGFLD